MKLRPHHLLCIRFYAGHGYSDAFNKKMREVISFLHTGATFTLTDGPDDLCESCPNLNGVLCSTQEKVARYDRKTLAALGLRPGVSLTYPEAKDLTDSTVFQSQAAFDEICGDCEWQALCHRKAE